MTKPSQQAKWNQIYRNKELEGSRLLNIPQPCSLLSQYHYLLPSHGTAIDIACGAGGNAIFLANHGLTTQAIDISDVAIEQLNRRDVPGLTAHCQDVEKHPALTFSNNSTNAKLNSHDKFDVIVVSCYLYRDLCPAIIEALAPGGLLFYQTFHQQKQTSNGPSNPKFLLKNNELLDLFDALDTLIFHQLSDQGDLSQGNRNLSSLIAQKLF